ncbi:MAG TPA: hypothetical protein VFO34_01480 [Candidatus Acidoferrales bacterium]|nr:hypothetical protein [Candidatus Acidoferrales bacterium]
MVYTLLSLTATVLLLAVVTSYVILRAAVSERPIRKLLLLLVVITPPVAVFAIIKSMFVRPKPLRYSEALGTIEDEIERERAGTFGGKIMRPSFSERWKVAYLFAVEKSAAAAARLDSGLNRSLCGISHLR